MMFYGYTVLFYIMHNATNLQLKTQNFASLQLHNTPLHSIPNTFKILLAPKNRAIPKIRTPKIF